MTNNGWAQWSKHVLHELERLNETYEKLDKRLRSINTELTRLQTEVKFKSGLWGALAGAIPAVVVLAWVIVKGASK